MPIRIRLSILMPIRIRILPKEVQNFCKLLFTVMPVYIVFFVLISVIVVGVIIFCTFDNIYWNFYIWLKWIRIRICIKTRLRVCKPLHPFLPRSHGPAFILSYSLYFIVADPGCLSRAPDPNFFFPSRIRIFLFRIPNPFKELMYFSLWFLSSRKYDPGC